MRKLKLFRSKLNLVLIVFFSVLLLVISVKSSYANCIPGEREFKYLRSHETICPNPPGGGGYACEFDIMEEKRKAAICVPSHIATTESECRIRESLVATGFPPWYWPIEYGGSTLRGPCFEVIGSAPCGLDPEGNPYYVTIWWQWVENLGTEDACQDLMNCFFCKDYNGDGVITLGIPECGLRNSNCP